MFFEVFKLSIIHTILSDILHFTDPFISQQRRMDLIFKLLRMKFCVNRLMN